MTSRNRRTFCRLIAVLALLVPLSAGGQEAQPSNGDGITVSGSGEVKSKPNVVEISATVSGDAELAADAIVKYRDTKRRGLKAIVVRPFNVTGPRQSKAAGFVMPTFVQQAQAGAPLTVFAGGQQTRAFLAATDLARFLLENLDAAFATGLPIFNVGNPHNTISVLDLAHRIKRLTGSVSRIDFVDGKKIHGELYEEAASVDKLPVLEAARAAGWEPSVDLDTLIRQTIAFYHAHGDMRDDAAA